VLRWSIGGRTTTRRHVAESFERVKALARA